MLFRSGFNESYLRKTQRIGNWKAILSGNIQIILEESFRCNAAMEHKFIAVVVEVGPAVFTKAASDGWFYGNSLTDFQIGNASPKSRNLAGWFVAKKPWVWSLNMANAPILIPMQITAADAYGSDLYSYLTWSGIRRLWNFAHFHGAMGDEWDRAHEVETSIVRFPTPANLFDHFAGDYQEEGIGSGIHPHFSYNHPLPFFNVKTSLYAHFAKCILSIASKT